MLLPRPYRGPYRDFLLSEVRIRKQVAHGDTARKDNFSSPFRLEVLDRAAHRAILSVGAHDDIRRERATVLKDDDGPPRHSACGRRHHRGNGCPSDDLDARSKQATLENIDKVRVLDVKDMFQSLFYRGRGWGLTLIAYQVAPASLTTSAAHSI
jgi:hypothetical protein